MPTSRLVFKIGRKNILEIYFFGGHIFFGQKIRAKFSAENFCRAYTSQKFWSNFFGRIFRVNLSAEIFCRVYTFQLFPAEKALFLREFFTRVFPLKFLFVAICCLVFVISFTSIS